MKNLKSFHGKVMKNWEDGGNKISYYICSHCRERIKTRRPGKLMVTAKGYWDSVKVCPLCGKYDFVLVYPSGKTVVKKIGI